MAKQYTVTITFTGTAHLTLEGETVEEIREKAAALKIEDLARQGYADVTQLKVGAREVKLKGSTLINEDDEETGPKPKRPSGWYRPA